MCDGRLRTTELTCERCATRLCGTFVADPPPLARLAPEHQHFVETFVRCRGVIRDVEKALGLSYPTVRARLDAAVAALEQAARATDTTGDAMVASPDPPAPAPAAPDNLQQRRDLLEQVAAGRLDPARAVEALRRLG